jgi:hypothetical protein
LGMKDFWTNLDWDGIYGRKPSPRPSLDGGISGRQ